MTQSINQNQCIEFLKNQMHTKWNEVLETSKFANYIRSNTVSKTFWIEYLTQTYHYTKHNARNQAVVGALRSTISDGYMKFCFHHAFEETGHEKMCLHDLSRLGVDPQTVEACNPLLETETLISYIYWVSMTGNPLRRLGYSFWAESSYGYFDKLLKKVKTDLDLSNKDLTFFIAHSDIDADHAAEVEDVIRKNVRTQQDLDSISEVLDRSLELTIRMLDAVTLKTSECI